MVHLYSGLLVQTLAGLPVDLDSSWFYSVSFRGFSIASYIFQFIYSGATCATSFTRRLVREVTSMRHTLGSDAPWVEGKIPRFYLGIWTNNQ
jgi:hypothetical protein